MHVCERACVLISAVAVIVSGSVGGVVAVMAYVAVRIGSGGSGGEVCQGGRRSHSTVGSGGAVCQGGRIRQCSVGSGGEVCQGGRRSQCHLRCNYNHFGLLASKMGLASISVTTTAAAATAATTTSWCMH